jgi:hypothetical protein
MNACEEKDDLAIAHVVVAGRSSHQRYKDTATLRRYAATWGVVLPPTFGKSKRR